MKVIIVGGVAGGMSAATRLRRLDEFAEIIVFEKGPYVSFANCGLPYHVSGEIEDRSELILQTPESLTERFNLDVRINHEVIDINPNNKQITYIAHGEKKTKSYDKLVLSPGATPFIPPIKGSESTKNTHSLRNIPDLDGIMKALGHKPKTATVVGAGFIGLEMAENLALRGIDVTVVEMAPQVLPPLDVEMAKFVELELKNNGIQVLTGTSVTEFQDEGQTVILSNGKSINSDITLLSVGVKPACDLAKSAGIKLGVRDGILVDEHYQTSVKDIYAVGDAIIVKNQLTNQDALIALANPANRQGRQVADVIAGIPRKNKGSIGTSIVRIFNLSAAATGLSEHQAIEANLNATSVHVRTNDHAGYFPGATPITLKLIFNPDNGAIYGAQAVGQKGVDKRIDVIATAIKGGLTVFDLPELEFTYAPPFGSAKDNINMAGYAAINVVEGYMRLIQWHEVADQIDKGKRLIDVRSAEEIEENGAIKDALNIPLNELRHRLNELDKNHAYIISCASGQRSYIAERMMRQHGFDTVNLDGAFGIYSMMMPENIIKH